jgi:hypothetical protein
MWGRGKIRLPYFQMYDVPPGSIQFLCPLQYLHYMKRRQIDHIAGQHDVKYDFMHLKCMDWDMQKRK